jgi:hypothetical protein
MRTVFDPNVEVAQGAAQHAHDFIVRTQQQRLQSHSPPLNPSASGIQPEILKKLPSTLCRL